jgi:transposase
VTASESLPTDLAAAHAMILAERAARLEAEAVAASAKADAALIGYLKLEIEKLRRLIYGGRSERRARLLEQMELQLEELEATATEMNWRFKGRRPSHRPSDPSNASGHRANRSPTTSVRH